MVGICGFFSNDPSISGDVQLSQRMTGALQPFPGAQSETFQLEKGRLGCKSRQDANLSFAQQEAISCIVDGHFWWRDEELESYRRSHGNPASVCQAYRKHGDSLLSRLAGAFSICLYDSGADKTMLAVDRFGIKPLSYTQTENGAFAFASTSTALLAVPGVDSSLSLQSIFNYSYFHVVPAPQTIFKHIKKLDPAQYLTYQNNEVKLGYYWSPQFSEQSGASLSSLSADLLQHLRSSIGHCEPDDHFGTFLSGGTDSSTVAGLLRQHQNKEIPTYSIGFSQQGYDEISYARIASSHFKTKQNEYYVTPEDVLNAIPEMASAYDEPFGNSSAIPTLFCARLARQNGTEVMLAGDGGDEIFAGNSRYAKQKLFEHYYKIPAALRKNVLEKIFLNSALLNRLTPTRKLSRYIEQARVPMPARMETYNFLSRTELSDMFCHDFMAAINTSAPAEALAETYNRSGAQSLLNKMLFLDWKITLADNDLRKVNRMCELAGIEVRYPLLDDELVDFSLSIPSALKLKGMKLRYFYKESLKNFLPAEIITKSKHGFGLPFGEWLKTSPKLQQHTYDNLSDLKARGYFSPAFVDNLITEHRSGHAAYYGTMVWVLSMLEEWLRSHKL